MSERPETPHEDPDQEQLTVSVRRQGGAGVVEVVGELDHDTAPALARAIGSLADAGVTCVVVDCSQLGFCDSTGLNVLLKARLATTEDGGRFLLAGPGPQLRRLLELTGADGVFETHSDLATALADA
ncbi:STAS domain-containing protein [Streptacidiphilus neutrinimicus]|uniref:STAS domain-containing protein n=1 Tax=Streptacidiphilus neutrinimicus TaxID=105420 RepID=UPI0005A93913|nr:STAS domain-containing protein [Streptacidiphilus neutrinimicus]